MYSYKIKMREQFVMKRTEFPSLVVTKPEPKRPMCRSECKMLDVKFNKYDPLSLKDRSCSTCSMELSTHALKGFRTVHCQTCCDKYPNEEFIHIEKRACCDICDDLIQIPRYINVGTCSNGPCGFPSTNILICQSCHNNMTFKLVNNRHISIIGSGSVLKRYNTK